MTQPAPFAPPPPAAPDGAPALHAASPETQWARLHPLSPVVRAGAIVAGLVVIFGSQLSTSRRGQQTFPWVGAVVLVVAAIGGVVSWLVTRWRLHGGDLQIETGLIRRQSVRVPLARIQAVDVIAPVTARVLGLAEVRVVVAGRGSGRTRLAYLSAEQAQRVRAMLLALAHGLAGETPEPPAQPLLRLDNARVLVATALSAPTNLLLVILVLSILLIVLVPSRETAAAAGTTATLLISIGPEIFRRVNAVYDFQLAEAADGLRLRRGLLQTRSETLPYGRIQAVRWVEPLFWRPFGWCRLEVDVARQRGSRGREEGSAQLSRLLLPVGSREHAAWLLDRVLPGATPVVPASAQPPRRALIRAPFSYHYLAAWHDHGRYVYARTGRIRPAVIVLPLEKIQSLRQRQGPVQRWLHLASAHVDTAGRGWQADALCRDVNDADSLVQVLTVLARQSRRTMVQPQHLRTSAPGGG